MLEMREDDRKVATGTDGCGRMRVRMRATREAQMRHVRVGGEDRPF
jgi:hypothetical protein